MFITFEGPDGSGKTTQIGRLSAWLRDQGHQLLVTREPGGTPISERIREVIHDVAHTAMTSEAEILLYSAARAQLVGEVIRPALATGKIVLCDRYADSTYAYQGYGRQLDLEALINITHFATGGLQPDLTLYFDINVADGLARRVQGEVEMNRMDLQQQAFYERVRAGYRQLIAKDPARWVVIDAARGVDAIQADVRQIVAERLQKTE